MSYDTQPTLIRRLAETIHGRWPESLGWRMIHGSPRGLVASLIHARPHLSDSGMVPGYRVESPDGPPLTLSHDRHYPNIFVRSHDYDFPPEADALVEAAEAAGLTWLMVEVSEGGEQIRLYERDGTRPLLPPPTREPELHPARLEIRGRESLNVDEPFPFRISVHSEGSVAAFSVRAEHPGFVDRVYHYLVGDEEGPPLGRGVLEFDVLCRPGQPDVLVVSPSEFPGGIKLTELAVPPRGQPRSSFRAERPLYLHVIFDRTTLDPNAWSLALNAIHGFGGEAVDDEAYGRQQAETVSWNRELRETLASALGEAVGELHKGETIFHLWWFADTPKSGIAPLTSIPSARTPFGDVTATCPPQRLPQFLNGSAFEYAPGFDLFDAVDEVLERVAEVVQEGVARHEQHAVLLAGDSPPPPSGKEDVLWERLVRRPPRTNARCSPLFENALQTLRRLQVPAGWLYLSLSEPAAAGARQNFGDLHQDFLSLKQEILRALQQVSPDDLVVEDCSGVGEMSDVLRKIFERMAYRKPEVVPLDCSELLPRVKRIKTWK